MYVGHKQDFSPELIDSLARALSSHLAKTRLTFDIEIKNALDRHEKHLLKLLKVWQGCACQETSKVVASDTEPDMHTNGSKLSVFSKTSETLPREPSFELPVTIQELLQSNDVLEIARQSQAEAKLDDLLRFISEQDLSVEMERPIEVEMEQEEPAKMKQEAPKKVARTVTTFAFDNVSESPAASELQASEAGKMDLPSRTRSSIGDRTRSSIGDIFETMTGRYLATTDKNRSREVKRLPWWRDLDDPSSSRAAAVYSSVMNPLIFVSVILSMLSRCDPPVIPGFSGDWLGYAQIMFDVLFTLEFLLRFTVAYSKLNFLTDPFNIIDFLASMPLLILDGIDDFSAERVNSNDGQLVKQVIRGLGPVFKVCKILRRFPTFQILIRAFSEAMEALPVLMFVFGLIGLTFGSLLYVVERNNPPKDPNGTSITTFQQAIWLTVITMTTVGYGDFSPKTGAGRILVGLLVVIQVLYMALPLGIIGQEFTNIWSQRHRFMAMKLVRTRMTALGLSFHDIPNLFRQFGNEDDAIDFAAFQRLCNALGIKMKQRQLEELYKSFDDDMGGSIDPLEFAAAVFPKEYKSLVEKSADQGKCARKSHLQWG